DHCWVVVPRSCRALVPFVCRLFAARNSRKNNRLFLASSAGSLPVVLLMPSPLQNLTCLPRAPSALNQCPRPDKASHYINILTLSEGSATEEPGICTGSRQHMRDRQPAREWRRIP